MDLFDSEIVGYWRRVDKDGNWEDVKYCHGCNKIVPIEHKKEESLQTKL